MIYLDNAATTPMDRNAIEVYAKYACDCFYNPSALYSKALDSSNAIKKARNTLLKALGATSGDIIWTASGTEADNIAMFCANKHKKGKVIIGSTEHSAIYNCAKELSYRGYEIIYAPCDKYGKTLLNQLEQLLDSEVVLVSIMHVCNETGAINDLNAISKLIRKHSPKAIFHSDGVQAFGKINFCLANLEVDLYSISAHKINGCKGLGALWKAKNINLRTFVFGGGQEFNIRSATENVPAIMAFESLLHNFATKTVNFYKHARELQKNCIQLIQSSFPLAVINTNESQSSPNIVSFSINNTRGEVVSHCMEDNGIIIGTGSACASKKSNNRIPLALGLENKYHSGMLRISFGYDNTLEEIVTMTEKLIEVVADINKYQKV